MKDRIDIDIDYDNGAVFVNGREIFAEEWDRIDWEREHFVGTDMNVESLKKNIEVVSLLRKLKSNSGIGDIKIANIDRNSKEIYHRIYVKYSITMDEYGDDINTLRKIVELCDGVTIAPIIHDENCSEGVENYCFVLTFSVSNIWDKNTYR